MSDLNVFNATLEKWPTQINSKYYCFEPRSITKVPEEYAWVIEGEYKPKGLFVIRPGDDVKAKERTALISYLGYLNMSIVNHNAFLDMMKAKGKTVDKPKDMIRKERWIKEITAKLELEAPLEYEASFTNEQDIRADVLNMFSTAPKVEIKKVGPTPTSFDQIDIEKEVV